MFLSKRLKEKSVGFFWRNKKRLRKKEKARKWIHLNKEREEKGKKKVEKAYLLELLISSRHLGQEPKNGEKVDLGSNGEQPETLVHEVHETLEISVPGLVPDRHEDGADDVRHRRRHHATQVHRLVTAQPAALVLLVYDRQEVFHLNLLEILQKKLIILFSNEPIITNSTQVNWNKKGFLVRIAL